MGDVVLGQGEAVLPEGRVNDALDVVETHFRRWHDRDATRTRRQQLQADLDRYMAEHPNDPQVIELRKHPKGTP
jgi:hypothetical protein